MEKIFISSSRQHRILSPIQALKLYLLGIIFAYMSIKTADLLLNKLTNQLSKLYKHMESEAIVLKQVQKFLIISLKILKKKFGPFL